MHTSPCSVATRYALASFEPTMYLHTIKEASTCVRRASSSLRSLGLHDVPMPPLKRSFDIDAFRNDEKQRFTMTFCSTQTMATRSRSITGTSNKVNKVRSCNVMENHQNASKLVIGRLAKRTVLLLCFFCSRAVLTALRTPYSGHRAI